MSNLVLKKNSSDLQEGAHGFYKITHLNGESKGSHFFIKAGERKTIGRGQTCDVVIKDLKASREHAELIWYKENLVLSDLKSQNGLIINDEKTLQGLLEDGDRFIVGQSVFKVTYESIKKATNQIHIEVKEEVPEKKSGIRLLVGVLGFILVFIIFMGDGEKVQVKKENENSNDTVIDTSILKRIEKNEREKNKTLEKEISNYVKLGLRELREKNYFRAITEFNKALGLRPSDPQAQFYYRKTNEEIDKAVQQFNIDAKRDIDSLKFRKAWVSYCGIIRLLHNYPEDKRYQDAKENLENVEKTLGYEDGETSCLSK